MLKKTKVKILVIALTIVFVIGALFVVSGSIRSPEKTVEGYISALNKGNVKKAIKYTDIEKDDPHYNEMVDDFDDLKGEEIKFKVIIDKVEVDEEKESATVYFFIVYEKPGDIHVDHNYFHVDKTKGKWLLDKYHL